MATITRTTAEGILQAQDPNTGAWMPVLLPMPLTGGLEVKLSNLQLQLIDEIRGNSGKLDDLTSLLTKATEIYTFLQNQGNATENIENAIATTTNPRLTELRDLITQLQALTQTATDATESMRAIVQNNVVDYTAYFVSTIAAIQNGYSNAGALSIKLLELTTPDTEYSFVIPQSAKRYAVKCRAGGSDVLGSFRYARVAGVVAGESAIAGDTFYHVEASAEESESGLKLPGPLTLYFASDTPGLKLSIKYWS